jgi:predicted nuclease of predicted toxin-antitoxin system
MAKKRVFLYECVGHDELAGLFGRKAHTYTARDLGVTGKEDTTVITRAIEKKCLIVTVNKDFLAFYKNLVSSAIRKRINMTRCRYKAA